MLRYRLIPILLLDGNKLVKTTGFDSPKYVGDPINAIRIFNEKEVDELIVLDIAATRFKRNPNYELIEQIASECFMPLCYGGGISNIDQVKRLFQCGIEKVSLRSSAILFPKFINLIASQFGSQATVVSLDIIRSRQGPIKLFQSHKEEYSDHEFFETLHNIIDAGAGELILTSIKREGTGIGLDLDLIQKVSANLQIPLVVNGGLGSLDHAKQAFQAGADAVAGGSFFVFHGKYKAVLLSYPSKNELDSIQLDLQDPIGR